MVGFSDVLDIGQLEDPQMIKKKINKWKKIVTRFKSKSIKMIKNVHRKLDGYSL